jgi:hypothetical protein
LAINEYLPAITEFIIDHVIRKVLQYLPHHLPKVQNTDLQLHKSGDYRMDNETPSPIH